MYTYYGICQSRHYDWVSATLPSRNAYKYCILHFSFIHEVLSYCILHFSFTCITYKYCILLLIHFPTIPINTVLMSYTYSVKFLQLLYFPTYIFHIPILFLCCSTYSFCIIVYVQCLLASIPCIAVQLLRVGTISMYIDVTAPVHSTYLFLYIVPIYSCICVLLLLFTIPIQPYSKC